MLLILHVGFGGFRNNRFDAPDTAADRRLRKNQKHSELTGGVRMRSAAKLDRRTGLDDPNELAVFLARHRDRSGCLRFFDGQLVRDEMMILTYQLVDTAGNCIFLLRREAAARPTKIESHAIDTDPRTRLHDFVAQDVLQRALQKVRRGVMTPNLFPPYRIDCSVDAFTASQNSRAQCTVMRNRIAGVLRVGYVEDRLSGRQHSMIADLTAALGVERRTIQNDLR